ncbi:FkbM family methyltransferase [Methylopila henanensis]|uniref:FkbM family methyltransferase n=1 Tax=Methylopila henanensis TaxID=873516 RepID=A0ABW4KE71_9HYPH
MIADATIEPPYGAHRAPRFVEAVRSLGDAVPDNAVGRRLASLLRRVCFAASAAPYDVEVFPTIHARLRPATNRTEKHVFLAAHLWDAQERRALETALFAADPAKPFVFVDVGANAGFYGLALASVGRRAGRGVSVLAIEPDPINRARLEANVAASAADVTVEPAAVGRVVGVARMIDDPRNRGESRLAESGQGGGVEVEVKPLGAILAAHGLAAVDAMKVDVEGMDFEVVAGLFETAPAEAWPRMMIVEVGRSEAEAAPMIGLLRSNGYEIAARTRLNVVAALSGQV